MRSSLQLGQLAGISIGIHYTWVFAFVLIAWSLATGYFPTIVTNAGAAVYWTLGVVAALLLFASVLVHELSHSLVARSRGLKVDSITLFIFGGVSNLTTEATTPGDEFFVAIVGPVSSIVLAGICWAVGQTLPGASPVGALVGYLAFINLLLGGFNLVPGFPLDGGRVLRAVVWGTTGNLQRATQVASYAGQAVGWLLIVWGFARLLSGDLLGGVWTAFIGWFLNSSADSTRHEQVLRDTLHGVPVSILMDPAPAVAEAGLTVQDFVFEHVLQRGNRALPIVGDGALLGIVTLGDAKKLPRDAWPTTGVTMIMTAAPLKTVAADTELSAAIGLMADSGLHQLPVLLNGRLVGMLSRADIMRFLQLRQELHLAAGPVPPSTGREHATPGA